MDRSSTAALPPLIGALLRMPVDAVHERMLRGMHAAGFDDIIPAHLDILRYPGPHDMRPSDVATHAGISKQAANYLLGQLETLGYLRREDDPDDRRSRRIRLTARGERLRTTIRGTVEEIERELQEQLGEKRFRQLKTLLVELNATPFVQSRSGAAMAVASGS